MNLYHRSLALIIVIFACSLLGVGQSRALQFQALGRLSADMTESMATGMSADGTTIVGRVDAIGAGGIDRSEAFRWTAGKGMIGLDESGPAQYSEAMAVSFDGSAVAGACETVEGTLNAYYWTHEQGMVFLNQSPAYGFSLGTGISADGSVIVGFEALDASLTGARAVRWTGFGQQLRPLRDLGGSESRALDVSADGTVVVGVSKNAAGKDEGYHWTLADGMFGLGHLEGYDSSRANAVSADGATVVGSLGSDTGTQAFLWHAQTGMIGLGDLAGGDADSTAKDVSADGSVVVGSALTADGEVAFVWDAQNGMRSLQRLLETEYASDLEGWILLSATAISDDGSIIGGYGLDPDGYRQAWRIDTRAVPIPNNLWLIVTGVIGIVAMRFKRKSGSRTE